MDKAPDTTCPACGEIARPCFCEREVSIYGDLIEKAAFLHKLENAALEIKFLIVKGGGMATKSAVEDVLMPLFGIDRCAAHEVLNGIELKNMHPCAISRGEVYWNHIEMQRPEPKLEDYPTLTVVPFGRR